MLVLLGLVLTVVMVHSQDDQSGFISIDCGIVEGSSYADDVTGIKYISDADQFRDTGEFYVISSKYNLPNIDKQLTTLTSFPQSQNNLNKRHCYTLKPSQGKNNRYLIRASFKYGNYDSKSEYPEFDVHLGPDYWDTVKPGDLLDKEKIMEIIHVPTSDYIHVCLVDTGRGTPFISAIELRLLPSYMYNETSSGSLYLHTRQHFETNFATVRYKADKYDRMWFPASVPDSFTSINTADEFPVGLFELPLEVISTAVTPSNPNASLVISWDCVNTTYPFFMYLHFAEIQLLKANDTRKFNIYLNDNFLSGPFSPQYDETITLYNPKPVNVTTNNKIKLSKTNDSTLPPIINAYELYILKNLQQRHTDDQDVDAMWSIKTSYRLTRNWQGDPCAPHEFVWGGLDCRYNDTGFSRIIFLNLSTSGLKGEIDPGVANLTMLETLDLSRNYLNGSIPAFLSELKFLKVLNLQGNNFIGPVPEKLLAKLKDGSLSMSFDGQSTGDNGTSCGTNQCKSKKDYKIIAPVVATVVILFAIVTGITIIWIIKRQKAHDKEKTSMTMELKKQKFTYSEVKSITDNFKVVIGKGGFGEVYKGKIGDAQVAVKMLSESSQQGNKEFQAEASLLLTVHHKNLTSLVGYCDEGNHKGIIYEYMAGNLDRRLFDTSLSVLNWEERLQIGYDTANGLEYLHYGCKPPIVHRDVKCSNILLNGACNAKLADFGLSKAFQTEGGTHISTAVAGTPGYLDPDYQTSGRLTEKSDVYSFGIVFLVIITGQPAIIKDATDSINISTWVKLKLEDVQLKNIVDHRLLGDFDINSAWKAVELAMACVAQKPNERPTIKEVVTELSNSLAMERARKEMIPREFIEYSSLNLESAYDPSPR